MKDEVKEEKDEITMVEMEEEDDSQGGEKVYHFAWEHQRDVAANLSDVSVSTVHTRWVSFFYLDF